MARGNRLTTLSALLTLLVAAAPLAATAQEPIPIVEVARDAPVDFEKEVLPIFKRNCVACHNAATAESELVLETPQVIRQGGASGPAVVPRNGAESLLLLVASHQSEPLMPPPGNKVNAAPLTGEELGLIKLWIDQGAEGTVSGGGPLTWQPLPPGVNPIYAVAMTADGQYVACGRANQVFIYHLPTGTEVCRLTDPALLTDGPYRRPGLAHLDIVQSLAFNPQGDLLASGGFAEVKLWRRPANVQRFNLAAAEAAATSLAVSPDRKWMATGGEDNRVKLWDLSTGAPGPVLEGHAAAVTGLRFSADGMRLASSSLDRSIRVWNVADGAAIGRIDAPTAVNAVALVGDGSRIASGGAENLVRLWTLPTQPSGQLAGLPNPLSALAVSADRKYLAAAGAEGRVVVVDIAAGTTLHTLTAHAGGVSSLAFNAAGNRLASGGADGATRVWDLANGQQVAVVSGAIAPVDAVALHPGGNQVASAWGAGEIAVWKLDVPATRPFAADNSTAPATVAAVSPNGQWLATDGVVDGKPAIVLRDVASGNVARVIPAHEGAIAALAFSPDSSRLASGSADATARVWNVADGAPLGSVQRAAAVTGVAFNSNGQQLVTGAADASLKLSNVADGAELKAFAGHGGAIAGVAMTTDDQAILSISADATARVWNPADGAQLLQINVGAAATGLALSRDNARLAVAAADNAVKVYQRGDGALLHALAGHAAPAKSLAFSPDGQRLVGGAAEKHALVWDLTTGKSIERLPVDAGLAFAAYGADAGTLLLGAADKSIAATSIHFERVCASNLQPTVGLAFGNDGGMVFAASADGSLRGLGAGDGQQRWAAAHGAAVHDLASSPDGQWLATAGEDMLIRIWNAGNGGGGPQAQLGPATSPVRSVAFSRDNLHVAGGSSAAGVTVYELQTGIAVQAFGEHAAAVETIVSTGEAATAGWISSTADGAAKSWPHLAVRRMTGHNAAITSVDTFPNNPVQFISGSEDGVVRMWNADNGQQMAEFAHGGPVASVAVRPDGLRFVSAGANNIAKLWNATNNQIVAELRGDLRLQNQLAKATRELQRGQALIETRKQELAAAEAAVPVATEASTKAAEALATATTDFNTKAEAARVANEAKVAAETAAAEAVAASTAATEAATAAKAAAAGDANNVDLANAAAAAEQASVAAAQKSTEAATAAAAAAQAAQEANAALKVSEDAKTAAQRLADETAAALKKSQDAVPLAMTAIATAEQAAVQRQAEVDAATAAATAAEMPLRTVAFSPDNKQLAVGGDDATVHTYDAETGAAFETYKGHAGVVRAVAFASERGVVSASADKSAIAWDLAPTWTLERTLGGETPLFADRVIALDFSPNGALLAAGGGEPSRSGELKVFNVADGALVRDLPDAHSDTVFGVDFSTDGKLLASCAADKFVKVFDLESGSQVRSFEGHTHHVLGVAWRFDGKVLASCGADNVIKVWNFETGDQLQTMQGYAKQVTSITFIGETSNTVSSGGDATLRMHNADNAQNYRTFSGASDFLYSSASTPNGLIVVGGGQDSVLRVWNGENAQIIKSFDPPAQAEAAATEQAAR